MQIVVVSQQGQLSISCGAEVSSLAVTKLESNEVFFFGINILFQGRKNFSLIRFSCCSKKIIFGKQHH